MDNCPHNLLEKLHHLPAARGGRYLHTRPTPTRRSGASRARPSERATQQLKEGACCLTANSGHLQGATTRLLGQAVHKSWFNELGVTMFTNETPLAAGTHKLSLRAC